MPLPRLSESALSYQNQCYLLLKHLQALAFLTKSGKASNASKLTPCERCPRPPAARFAPARFTPPFPATRPTHPIIIKDQSPSHMLLLQRASIGSGVLVSLSSHMAQRRSTTGAHRQQSPGCFPPPPNRRAKMDTTRNSGGYRATHYGSLRQGYDPACRPLPHASNPPLIPVKRSHILLKWFSYPIKPHLALSPEIPATLRYPCWARQPLYTINSVSSLTFAFED